jgi:hypothetical protein
LWVAGYSCWMTLFHFYNAHFHHAISSHIHDILLEKAYKAYFRIYNISLEDASRTKFSSPSRI